MSIEPLSERDTDRLCGLTFDMQGVLDTHANVLRANETWLRVMGGPPSQDFSLADLIHPDDAATWREAFERCASVHAGPGTAARYRRATGEYRLLDWRFASTDDGEVLCCARDVTDRRRHADAARALRVLEDEAELVAELGSWRLDLSTGHLDWSPEMYRIFGVDPRADVDLAQVTETSIHPDDRDRLREINRLVLADGKPRPAEYRVVRPDGDVRWVDARGRQVLDAGGAVIALTGFVQDITERRLEGLAANERELRLQAVIDNAPFGSHMYRLDPDGRLVFIGYNQKAVQMLGLDHEPLLGLELEEAFPGNVGTETPDRYRDVARTGVPWEVEQYAYDAEGVAGVFDVYAFSFGPNRVSVFFRDITDQKRAEVAALDSQQHFRAAFEQAAVGMSETTGDGRFVRLNDRFCEIVGYSREELLTLTFASVTDPSFAEGDLKAKHDMLAGRSDRYETEKRYVRKDGSCVWVHITVAAVRAPDGSVKYFLSAVEDIDARIAAESALAERERFVQSVVGTSPDLIYVYDLVEDRSVWDNFVSAGVLGYESADLHDFTPGLVGNIVHPDDVDLLRRHHDGYASARDDEVLEVEFRLRRADGEWRWFHSRGVAFRRDETGKVTQFLGVASDVTGRRRAEAALLASNEKLAAIVREVAEAMGRVAEARDPYTQDHEVRVNRLAHTIGVELGMAEDDLDALDMACLLHDVGKLRVPVEILTKPGRLSATEFALIKEHPQEGYEILKGIDFPWPIAEIVLQHHERIDGSGYPRGLTGDEILPVARVLSVADVVEAMATNRPYRPALGLDAAMAELSEQSSKYDPDVVAACVRVRDAGLIDL